MPKMRCWWWTTLPRAEGEPNAELQNVAERLFRAAGNQQGRSRMGGDGRLHAPKLPRKLILGTGERSAPGTEYSCASW